ncbi:hypothetical protein [Aridibaculum aurantiacum]|uniref:hypothetical protein n=1 Tax=Aridibaculum aurantiacum TaxID=2810307 RepID=UPI001A973656|nr:hypothetical protein [Aridibaculum aurantiacum]
MKHMLPPCLFILFAFLFSLAASAQPYKPGDRVEASYAGDWLRATIIRDLKSEGREGIYLIKYDDYSGNQTMAANLIRPPYRPNASQSFKVGDRVLFLRWDNKEYEGQVVAVDDKRYQLSYVRDGFTNTEWVSEISVKASNAAPPPPPPPANPPANGSNQGNNGQAGNQPGNNAGAPAVPGAFKPGDRVEVSYSGDRVRAIVKSNLQPNGSEGTYLIKYDDYSGEMNLAANLMFPLYRQNEAQTFTPGSRVLFTRWDNKEYEGEVVGVDGKQYNITYIRDGVKSTEWVSEIRVKAANNAAPVAAANFPGQKYKIGDRVRYDGGNFLTGPYFGTIISVDVDKRSYTVKDEKDASSRYSYPCYGVIAPGEKPDNSYFIGKWDMYVSGATFTYNKGDDKYRRISGGMKLQPLDIKADGTYTWQMDKKVIRGRWTERGDVPGITLLKGHDGLDWTVYQSTEAAATNKSTRDEIRLHHQPTNTGYYMGYRIGQNRSCVLANRTFR